MTSENRAIVSERAISSTEKIVNALKKMDEHDIKLLIVFNEDKFEGLLSLGDIQRAILDNVSLNSSVRCILRDDYRVASLQVPKDQIKDLMLKERIECMPIVDDGNIVDIYLWDDLFEDENKFNSLNIPVVVMAGGKGSRLKPLTNIIPKPLVPIGEKPVVEIIMDSFHDYGVSDFYLSVNYKSEMIEDYFNKANCDYHIDYFKEEKPLGTAGSLYLVKDKIQSDFFVTNCDILIKQDYSVVYDYHRESGNAVTMIAALMQHNIPYGTIEAGKNGELISMEEKPDLTFMVNVGVYILSASVLDSLNDGEFIHITDLISKMKNNGSKIGVFPISEKSWMDMGEWDEYQQTLRNYELKFNR